MEPLRADALSIGSPKVSAGRINIEVPHAALADVIKNRQLAVANVFKTLDVIKGDLSTFFPKITDTLPPVLDGTVLNPNGSPAANVSVEVQQPFTNFTTSATNGSALALGWPNPRTVTDERGGFRVQLPTIPVPETGLKLTVRGSDSIAELTLSRVTVLEAHVGSLILPRPLAPLETSVIAQLKSIQSGILATSATDVANNPEQFAVPGPQVMLGEGDCSRFFRNNSGVIDRFKYSVLIRLVEPELNHWEPVVRVPIGGDRFMPFGIPAATDSFWSASGVENAANELQKLGQIMLVNRQPIDRPVDVTAFHKQIEQNASMYPKAATLGLGYIVDMHQVWIPAGLSLGDLVYSLPLAPGEQQRIAIQEASATFSERDSESFSESEFQTFRETQDSSALEVFNSAFREAARGGSAMSSSSSTASGGATASTGIIGAIFGGGGVSAGYSNSSSSGSTSSWQNASRDFTSSAAEDMHSALGRVAAASRVASRTSIRMASASEREQVTTRIISNHNHNHALTMQYWEVLRHYNVSSKVDDVQLTCFVPFELVQWRPEGQPQTLSGSQSRGSLLARWEMLLRYYDVLYPQLTRQPEYSYGMRLLKHFASDPEAQPQQTTLQQDVVQFEVKGTFLPFEELFVTVVTKSGARLGPLKLVPEGAQLSIPSETFTSAADLLAFLKNARLAATDRTYAVPIPLPDWIARGDVARFDISRRSTSLTYKLKAPSFTGLVGSIFDALNVQSALTISFNPAQLERELGGPVIHSAHAKLPPGNTDFLSSLSFTSGEQMGTTLPLAAVRVAPVLSYTDILRIEAVFQHVVRNGVGYSRSVWASLSDEERAILLERYTIGVPQGGIVSADQQVPLLNCVANRVLGFFGNCAIMPFSIPPQVAASMKVSSRDVQDALLRFHRQAFQPVQSSITLPTRGTLGEAVLGGCNSSEKIDLTRFWNWQDSPGDSADAIPSSVFQAPQLLNNVTTGAASAAGSSAANPGSIISINNGAAANPNLDALNKLVEKSPDLAKELNMTGLDQLQKQISADTTSASEGRKEVIDSVTNIQTQAMKSAESIVKSVAEAATKVAATSATGGAAGAAGAAGGAAGGGG